MHANPFHRATYLTGATAVGKTDVGVALARRLDAEVIALDSMTLFRGLDIGTAKPTDLDRGGVPHHLIDILDPWDSASVADYRDRARDAVLDIESRGRRALFVGGTALYLKALLRGLCDGPAADLALRADLEADANREGDPALHARLAALDPRAAARLEPNDRRRVVRALEVITLTGRRLSELQAEHDTPAPLDVAVCALDRPRAVVHARINARVVAMYLDGLLDEVRRLLDHPRGIGPVAAQAAGYREAADLLAGRINLQSAIDRTQARTRQFAKRQSTWFRGLTEVQLVPIDDAEPPDAVADRLRDALAHSPIRRSPP